MMEAHSDGEDRKESTFNVGNLTLDLLEDILCRLPVKLLLQLRCVCKFWNSLISDDPIFAKKHLRLSRTLFDHHHLIACPPYPEFQLWESRLSSFFNSGSTSCFPRTPLSLPQNVTKGSFKVIGSCDGMLCLLCYNTYVVVWNPSISKFRRLPPSENQPKPSGNYGSRTIYRFGYDCLSNNYKVVAFCCYRVGDLFNWICKRTEVHTLGTNIWKTIQDLPDFDIGVTNSKCGIFLSGSINWLKRTYVSTSEKGVIFSFDLGNESYQELLTPDDGQLDVFAMNLGVLRDCLCILSHTCTLVIHVWLMEEYGNKDSWTKLFVFTYGELYSIPDLADLVYPLYILEDGQLLLDSMGKLAVYNSRSRAAKILKIPPIASYFQFENHVYIESLISL